MPNTEQRRRPRSQRESLRPSAAPTALPSVAVGGRRYDRLADSEGREFVVVAGISGTAETEPIPERRVRFVGTPVCVDVSLRQANRFIQAGDGDGSPPVALCVVVTGWSIHLDGVMVYGGMTTSADVGTALIAAASALPRLLALPARLWDEADWLGRPVYLDGAPARVAQLRAATGELVLHLDVGPPTDPRTVDALSDRIWWFRTTETSPPPDPEDPDGD